MLSLHTQIGSAQQALDTASSALEAAFSIHDHLGFYGLKIYLLVSNLNERPWMMV